MTIRNKLRFLTLLLTSGLAICLTPGFAKAAPRASSAASISESLANFLPTTSSFCAIGADSGKTYVDVRSDLLLAPASALKLLVTASALNSLGALFTAHTDVFVVGGIKEGVAKTVFIRGGLDPGFTTERAFLLARAVRSYGITKINELVLDDSALTSELVPQGARAFLSGISSFGLNWNSATVRGCLAPDSGAPNVIVDPFEFKARVRHTVRRGSTSNLSVTRGATDDEITASGAISAGACTEEYFAVSDPVRYTSAVLKGLFAAAGVESGTVTSREVPKAAKLLLSFPSRPLEELIKDMNYFSNNNMAEMFVALMGERSGEFSRDLGLERLRNEVKSRTPKSGAINLVDGSGLSPANRISAKVVCDTLAQEYRNSDTRLTFFASLPQFGISGTMKRRLRTVSGRAKTGSLSNVSSLAGLVFARSEPLVFAIIQNKVPDLVRAKAAEDVLVEKFSKL